MDDQIERTVLAAGLIDEAVAVFVRARDADAGADRGEVRAGRVQ
jgi:hypothetical protein